MISLSRALILAAVAAISAWGGAKEEDSAPESGKASERVEAYDDISSAVLEAQVILDRAMFSPGAIDGLEGKNAGHTLTAFQKANGLKPSGEVDKETSAALLALSNNAEILQPYMITGGDHATDFITSVPTEMADLAKLDRLSYTTITELLAERFHCTPELLAYLNPDADFSTGSAIAVPNVYPTWIKAEANDLEAWISDKYQAESGDAETPNRAEGESKEAESRDDRDAAKAKDSEEEDSATESDKKDRKDDDDNDSEDKKDADEKLLGLKHDDGRITSSGLQQKPEGDLTIVVTKDDTSLNVLDEGGQVVFHAPITAGSEHDPLPLGEWKVNGTERFPKFNYNPELFWDSEESDKKAKIPAGPNNPVGVAWIDISKPHYGLHGTPNAEKIGYSESHGCVRLTNWDVLRLADMVKPETKVYFLEKAEELEELQKKLSGTKPESSN